jgi:hypothetical protein
MFRACVFKSTEVHISFGQAVFQTSGDDYYVKIVQARKKRANWSKQALNTYAKTTVSSSSGSQSKPKIQFWSRIVCGAADRT